MNNEGPLRLAVCEAPVTMTPGDEGWRALAADARAVKANMFLLNEMPFGPWLCARAEPSFDDLLEVQRLHEQAIGHFRRALSLLERLAEKLLEEGLNGSQAARGQDTQNQKGALHRTLLGIG